MIAPDICSEYPWKVDLLENSLKYLAPRLTFRAGSITFDAKPRALTEADTKDAVRVMAFCPIPDAFSRTVRVEKHEDVPEISADYAAARDKIVTYVKALLNELERR